MTALSQAITFSSPPANSVAVGQVLDLMLSVDTFASGSRAVTWPANFKFPVAAWVDAVVTTDANKTTYVSFKFDGTNYIQQAQNRWI